MLISPGSRFRPELTALAFELTGKAAGFRRVDSWGSTKGNLIASLLRIVNVRTASCDLRSSC
jgi:hypothetical protein